MDLPSEACTLEEEASINTTGGHNLRDRNRLRPPGRYRDPADENARRAKDLHRKRTGRKNSITKRVKAIRGMIEESGSRKKITFMYEELKGVLREAIEIHEELMEILDGDDEQFTDDWIEDLKHDVSTCGGEVTDYLESRRGDDSSSIATSYVRRQCHNWIVTGSISGQTVNSESLDETGSTVQNLSSMFNRTLNIEHQEVDEQMSNTAFMGLTSSPPVTAKGDSGSPPGQEPVDTSSVDHFQTFETMLGGDIGSLSQTVVAGIANKNDILSEYTDNLQHGMYVQDVRHMPTNRNQSGLMAVTGREDVSANAFIIGADKINTVPVADTPYVRRAEIQDVNFKQTQRSQFGSTAATFKNDASASAFNIGANKVNSFSVTDKMQTQGIGDMLTHGNQLGLGGGTKQMQGVRFKQTGGGQFGPRAATYKDDASASAFSISANKVNSFPVTDRMQAQGTGDMLTHGNQLGLDGGTKKMQGVGSKQTQKGQFGPMAVRKDQEDIPATASNICSSGVACRNVHGNNNIYTAPVTRPLGYQPNIAAIDSSYNRRIQMQDGRSTQGQQLDWTSVGDSLYDVRRTPIQDVRYRPAHRNPLGPTTLTDREDIPPNASNICSGGMTHTIPVTCEHTNYQYQPNGRCYPQYSASSHNNSGVPRSYEMDSADSWIDELNPHNEGRRGSMEDESVTNVTLQWLSRQNLPRIKVPTFDGSAEIWIEFVIQFKEVIHKQPNITGAQRMAYLLQHVDGEAKRSTQAFSKDWYGYVCALKRLKALFGQRPKVAQAHITKATKGGQIKDGDMEGLTEFYYSLGDCLVTLNRMHYYSDLGSSDVLRQAVSRLPNRLQSKWGEYSYALQRRQGEPQLCDLEDWLGNRVMAARDAYLPTQITSTKKLKNNKDKLDNKEHVATLTTKVSEKTENCDEKGRGKSDKVTRSSCLCAEGTHTLSKCREFMENSPEERVKVARKNYLCYNCLKRNHTSRNCVSKFRCMADGCKQLHHTLLHGGFVGQLSDTNDQIKSSEKGDTPEIKNIEQSSVGKDGNKNIVTSKISLTKSSPGRRVHMQIVPVKVISPLGRSGLTYAMLDNASDSSLIREDFAESIGLARKQVDLSVGTITQSGEDVKAHETTMFVTSVEGDGEVFFVEKAFIMPKDKFHTSSQQLPTNFETDAKYKHLQGLGLHNISSDDVTVLVSGDVPRAIVAREIREGPKNQPIGIKTLLGGWSMLGGANGGTSLNRIPTDCHTIRINHNRANLVGLEEKVEGMWTTEAFSTMFDFKAPRSTRDQELLALMDVNTRIFEGHYVVEKLWKNMHHSLPNSKPMALKRLDHLCKRLRRQPELHRLYSNKLQEYTDKNYARKLTKEEASQTSHRTWYLPHHPVLNEHKPGKVRPVFDCAAKVGDICLNDMLETGPDLTNNLAGVVTRFRKYKHAVAGDIETMFYQVKVAESDRNSLRFLWRGDLNSAEIDTYEMLVHIFGAKDSPSCSSYALQRTAKDNKDKFSSDVVDTVLKDFYIDDWLKSFQSEDEAISLTHNLVELLQIEDSILLNL